MMQRKAFVLLSGGLDSTTCLYKAIHDYAPKDAGAALMYNDKDLWKEAFQNAKPGDIDIPWVEAFSVNYGQRHSKEMEYAHDTCTRLGITHSILDVGSLLSGATVMLTRDAIGNVDVPDIAYSEIKGVSPTYVPYRNGLMLSALVAQAQKYVNSEIADTVRIYDEGYAESEQFTRENADAIHQEHMSAATAEAKDLCGIYFGAHSEDAANWAYPDCTPEFIGAQANAIYIGTYMTCRLHTPLQWLMKSEIVSLGDKLGVPFANTWSCYKGEAKQCGTCPTCRSRQEAFVLAGVKDPTDYLVKLDPEPFIDDTPANPTTPNAAQPTANAEA